MYRHMLGSFYVTQWRLARGYFDKLQDYQNRRYCEDSYLNFFKWYGRTVQEVSPPEAPVYREQLLTTRLIISLVT